MTIARFFIFTTNSMQVVVATFMSCLAARIDNFSTIIIFISKLTLLDSHYFLCNSKDATDQHDFFWNQIFMFQVTYFKTLGKDKL